MNKISGILPSNARLASVDVSKASPTRRGHPNIGQPVIDASSTRATAKTALSGAKGAYAQVMDLRERNRENALNAAKLQADFFTSRVEPEIKESIEESREHLLAVSTNAEVPEEHMQEVGAKLYIVA